MGFSTKRNDPPASDPPLTLWHQVNGQQKLVFVVNHEGQTKACQLDQNDLKCLGLNFRDKDGNTVPLLNQLLVAMASTIGRLESQNRQLADRVSVLEQKIKDNR